MKQWLKKRFKGFGSSQTQNLITLLACIIALWIGCEQNNINKSLLKITQAQNMPLLWPSIEGFTYDLHTQRCWYKVKIVNASETPITDIQVKVVVNDLEKDGMLDAFEKVIFPSKASSAQEIVGYENIQNGWVWIVKVKFRSFYEAKEYCVQTTYKYQANTNTLKLYGSNPVLCNQW